MTAAQNLFLGAPWPLVAAQSSAPTYTSQALTTNGYRCCMVMQLDCDAASDTITHVGFRCASKTVATSITVDTFKCGVQTLDASGLPSGTYLGGGSPASQTFPNATYPESGFGTGTWHWIQLANSISINRGDRIAVVVERTATDASNYLTISRSHNVFGAQAGVPYNVVNSGAGNTKGAQGPVLALKSSGSVYGFPGTDHAVSQVFGGTAEVGMSFTLPTLLGSTYKVKGVRYRGVSLTGAGDATITLYSGNGSTRQQQMLQIDSDVSSPAAGSTDRMYEYIFPDGTLATLSTGTAYVVGLSHTNGANVGSLYTIQLDASGDVGAYPLTTNVQYANRTLTSYPPSADDDGTSFTLTATKRPWMELILADLTPPAGGSATYSRGRVVNP